MAEEAPEMTMAEAVERSISSAILSGRLDGEAHAAPIQALRELARRCESMSEKDNVTFPTMLKYMDALGLLPDEVTKETATAADGSQTSLSRMRGKFRSAR